MIKLNKIKHLKVKCIKCGDIIDKPRGGQYYTECNCNAVAVDFDRWGLKAHRIINADKCLIYNWRTENWDVMNRSNKTFDWNDYM